MMYFSGDLDKSEQNKQYEKTLQKGINLLKNNPNAIIDIIQVANRLSYLRGRLFEQNQQPSELNQHTGEGGCTCTCPTSVNGFDRCGNQSKNPSVDNPQDDPGKANVADNGDTGNSTFPADSNSITHRKCDDKYFDKLNELCRKDSIGVA